MTDLVCAWEPIASMLDDGLEGMLVRHWQEVGDAKDQIPLDPDWDGILGAEAEGRMHAMSARRGGQLVGYNAFLVARPLHYRASIFALNDVIYVDPAERGWTGVRLIKTAEAALWRLGVVRIVYHTKVSVRVGVKAEHTAGDILSRLGYRLFEQNWTKVRP